MGSSTIRITVVNHAAVDIARPAAVLWRDIVNNIAGGGGFAEGGYRIEPLIDDPRASLGGYRMRFVSGDRADAWTCLVSERNEEAMRLSLHAVQQSSGADGMVRYATYRAVPAGQGCRYQFDCHSTLDHQVGEGASREQIEASVAALRDQFDQALETSFADIKARLEAE